MKGFFKNYIEDIFVFSGASLIVAAAFLTSFICGLLVCGSVLVVLGLFIARTDA